MYNHHPQQTTQHSPTNTTQNNSNTLSNNNGMGMVPTNNSMNPPIGGIGGATNMTNTFAGGGINGNNNIGHTNTIPPNNQDMAHVVVSASILPNMSSPTMNNSTITTPNNNLQLPSSLPGLVSNNSHIVNSVLSSQQNMLDGIGSIGQLLNPTNNNFNHHQNPAATNQLSMNTTPNHLQQNSFPGQFHAMTSSNSVTPVNHNVNAGGTTIDQQQANQWMNFNQSSNNYQLPSNILHINQSSQMNMNSNVVNSLLNQQQPQQPSVNNSTIDSNLFNMLLGNNSNNNISGQIDMNHNVFNNNIFNTGLHSSTNKLPMNNIASNNIPNSPPMNNNWKGMENPVMSPNSYNRQFNNNSNTVLNQFTNQNFVQNNIPTTMNNAPLSNKMQFNNQNSVNNNQNMFVSYNMNNMNNMNARTNMNQQVQFQQANNNPREIVFEQSGYAKKRRESSTPSAGTTSNKKKAKKEKPSPQPKEKQIAKPSVPSMSTRIDILKPLSDRIIYYIMHFLPSFPDYGSVCQVSKRFSEICKVAYLQLDTLYLRKVAGLTNAKGAVNRFYNMREDYLEDVDVISVRRQLISQENDPNKRKSQLDKLRVDKKEVTKLVLNQVSIDSFKKLFENSNLSETLKEFTLIGHKFNSNSLKQFFNSLPKEIENVSLIGCMFNLDLPLPYYTSLRKDISPKMEIIFSEIAVMANTSNDEKSRKNKKKKLEEENPNPFIPSWLTVQELKDSVNIETLKKVKDFGLDLLTDTICDNISGACAAFRYGDIDCLNYVLGLMTSQSTLPFVNMIYQTLLYNKKNLLPFMKKFTEIFPQNTLLSTRFATVQPKQGKTKPTTSEKVNYAFQSLLRVDQVPTDLPLISKQSVEDKQLTPYLCACAIGSLEICTLISPEPLFQIDTDSNTGLHIACMNGSTKVAQYLIEKNHVLDAKNNKAQTILHSLMLSPPEKDSELDLCLQSVSERFAQRGNLTGILSARDTLGNTCLHYAVENRHSECVKLLLQYYSKGDNIENYLKIANTQEMTPILLVFSNNAPRNDKAANILISLMNNNFEQNFKQLVEKKDEDGDIISSKTIFTEILESDPSFSSSFLTQYLSMFPEQKDSILNYSPESNSASLIHYCVSLPKDTTLLVKWLIANGANVQQLDEHGKTFLHVAIEKESVENLDSIIDSLSSIMSSEQLKQLIMTQDKEKKYTVLHQCAISDKYSKTCTKLLSVGADPLALDAEKNTPLMVSIIFANYDASQLLLTSESKNLANGNNVTPIILLLRNSKDLKHFLNEKEINQTDYNNSIEKLEELTMKMLDAGTDISSDTILDYVDEDRPSALMLAIEGGLSMEIITKIVEHSTVFVNHQTAKSLVTPLHVACEEGYSEVVTLLIQKGANILLPDNNKSIPLIYAMIHSNADVVELILKHIDSMCKLGKGDDKLAERSKFFIQELSFECLESFILQAVSENMEMDLIKKILSTRMEQRSQKLRLMTKEKDGDYTIFTDQGASVLMVASQEGKLDIFKSYLQYLATFETFNGGEFTELSEIVKLGDQSNDSLAHYACMAPDNNKSSSHLKEKLTILEILVQNGASLDTQNDDGNTPLHLACREGFTPLAKFLLKHGCDKNISNNDGNTPDTFADDGGHYDLLAACFDEEVVEKPKAKPSNRNTRGTKRKSAPESDDEFVASDQDAESDEELDEDSEISDDEAPKQRALSHILLFMQL